MSGHLTPRLAVLLTLPPLLWAGNAVVGRLMVGQVPPLTLNLLRWVLTALILLPLGWRALRQPQRIARRWGHLALVGLLGVGLFNSLQYLALVTSTPMRSMAIITISTGAKVHRVALSTDSQMTSGATSAAASGRSSTNCKRHSSEATDVAQPVSRSAPRRLTSLPL